MCVCFACILLVLLVQQQVVSSTYSTRICYYQVPEVRSTTTCTYCTSQHRSGNNIFKFMKKTAVQHCTYSREPRRIFNLWLLVAVKKLLTTNSIYVIVPSGTTAVILYCYYKLLVSSSSKNFSFHTKKTLLLHKQSKMDDALIDDRNGNSLRHKDQNNTMDISSHEPPRNDQNGTDSSLVGSAHLQPVFMGNLDFGVTVEDIEDLFLRPMRGMDPVPIDRVDLKRGYAFVFFQEARSQTDKERLERYVDEINGMYVNLYL